MEENKSKENNAVFTLKRMRPQDYDTWEFALEMWIRQKYNSCSDYFETGKEYDYEMEPMEDIMEEYNIELDEMTKVAVLKDKYLQRGEVSKWLEKQKSNERLKESFAKDCRAVVGLMHQYMDDGMKTALYSIKEYKDSLTANDIWKMKCTIKKLLRGQDRATIYKDIAYMLACKPDGKTGERERFFKDFAKCVDKLLKRDDMTEAQILNCIVNSIFVHGAQKLPQLREEVKKELIKQVWDDYSTLIIKWNEYCLTLDNMGWEEPGDKDHIQANYTELNKRKTNVESEEDIIGILANKLYRLNNDGKPDTMKKQEMRTLLVNAMQKKFIGHCWNCWELNNHSALNCPVKVKSICDECSGSHHTNACGLIINKKSKVNKRPKKDNNAGRDKQRAIKNASMLMKNSEDEYSSMCIANILHQYEKYKEGISDSESDEGGYINANILNNKDESSSEEEDWDRGTRGNYKMNNKITANKLISGFSLSVNKGNGSVDRMKDKNVIKRDDAVRKLNNLKNELNELNNKYEEEKKRIMSNMDKERKNIINSMPRDMTYKAGKIRIERVMEHVIDNHKKECEEFNDKDLDSLIDMHRAVMTMEGAHELDIEERKSNIENNVGSWICNIGDESYKDITKNILSYVGKNEQVRESSRVKDTNNIESGDRKNMKLSSFKSPVRTKKWSIGLENSYNSEEDYNDNHEDDTAHDHKRCGQRKLVSLFEQEYCSESMKNRKTREKNVEDASKSSSVEEKLTEEEEEEENERINQQYYEWEPSQARNQVMEDYQSMNMRNAKTRNNYLTPQTIVEKRNRRITFGENMITNIDDHQTMSNRNWREHTSHVGTRKRVLKGADGIYRDKTGVKLELVSLITGLKEPVRTLEDLKRYYKYYNR